MLIMYVIRRQAQMLTLTDKLFPKTTLFLSGLKTFSTLSSAQAKETASAMPAHAYALLSVIERKPANVPSITAETVPEYVTSSAMFVPRFTPDRIRSGGVSFISLPTAIRTASVGVPVTL